MKKRMLFVFNPKAGKGRIKMHLLDIVDIFNKAIRNESDMRIFRKMR